MCARTQCEISHGTYITLCQLTYESAESSQLLYAVTAGIVWIAITVFEALIVNYF